MKTRGAAPEPGPSLTCAECVASCGAQQHADGSVELSSCQFHGQSPFTHWHVGTSGSCCPEAG